MSEFNYRNLGDLEADDFSPQPYTFSGPGTYDSCGGRFEITLTKYEADKLIRILYRVFDAGKNHRSAEIRDLLITR